MPIKVGLCECHDLQVLPIANVRTQWYTVNANCSNFKYTNNNTNTQTTTLQGLHRKKDEVEKNKNVLHSYFKSNHAHRWYQRKNDKNLDRICKV